MRLLSSLGFCSLASVAWLIGCDDPYDCSGTD